MVELNAQAAFHIQPKTEKQDLLLRSIESAPMTVAIGSAGTGKTFCVSYKAAQLLLKGHVDKIVLTRSNVSTGKSIGFFPGDIQEKMTPWLLPVLSNLEEAMGKGKFEYYQKKGNIQLQPIETIRGMSFENSFIIVDEAQNLTFSEMKAISTRLGEGSIMVFCGDPAQSDVGSGNGIEKFIDICQRHDIDLPVVRFGINDIVRSDIVGDLCKAFEMEEGKK